MPELTGREALEETFAEALGRASQRAARELLGRESLDTLTDADWRDIMRPYEETIREQLERIYRRSAGDFYDALGIGQDTDAIEDAARTWVREHTLLLIGGLIETSQRRFRDLLSDLRDEHISMTYFRDAVRDIFSPTRAEMIAATETTRAAVAAELQVVNGLRQYGLRYVAVWQTNNDALTCPICAPRHGKAYGDGWYDYPPSHPRCRCWINHVPLDVEGISP